MTGSKGTLDQFTELYIFFFFVCKTLVFCSWYIHVRFITLSCIVIHSWRDKFEICVDVSFILSFVLSFWKQIIRILTPPSPEYQVWWWRFQTCFLPGSRNVATFIVGKKKKGSHMLKSYHWWTWEVLLTKERERKKKKKINCCH